MGNSKKTKRRRTEGRVGVRKQMNCGLWCTCIEYKTNQDSTFQFDDGIIVEHRQWQKFVEGTIAYHPKHVGIRKLMNCGDWCTCIRDGGSRDCDFQFDDGTVVEHRTWNEFEKGHIAYPLEKERVGVRKLMNCGLWCTCIRYGRRQDCDFQFDDGTVVGHRTWQEFEKGKIAHPQGMAKDRVGIRKQMNCGLWCTCIRYGGVRDCDFQFGDSTIVERKCWKSFEEGTIAYPKDRVGIRKQMNCGLWCTCIKYKTGKNCTFRFEDGTVVEHRTWKNFEEGSIAYPKERVGIRKLMKCGLWCTCIRYGILMDCDFRFDDGTVVEHRQWQAFEKGAIAHPNLNPRDTCNFYGFQCTYARLIFDDSVYYKCIDLETGEKQILTPYEILAIRGITTTKGTTEGING